VSPLFTYIIAVHIFPSLLPWVVMQLPSFAHLHSQWEVYASTKGLQRIGWNARSEPSLCHISTHQHCWPNNVPFITTFTLYLPSHRPPSCEPLIPPKGVRAWSATTASNYLTLWGDSMTKRPVRFTTMTQSQSILSYPNFWWSGAPRGLIAGKIW